MTTISIYLLFLLAYFYIYCALWALYFIMKFSWPYITKAYHWLNDEEGD